MWFHSEMSAQDVCFRSYDVILGEVFRLGGAPDAC